MLIGKNIALRPTTADDMKLITDWVNDPAYGGPFENHWTVSLEGMQRSHRADGSRTRHNYVIIDRASGEPRGEAGHGNPFSDPDFRSEEFGYVVHPAFRGRGIASQAACILVNHLFSATPVERVQATVVVGNDASCRVLEHAGLSPEGILRALMFVNGRYADLHIYSILRAEWRDEAAYRARVREF